MCKGLIKRGLPRGKQVAKILFISVGMGAAKGNETRQEWPHIMAISEFQHMTTSFF